MEAKELRIGNLVYDNDNKLFHEVHTVSKDYIVLLFENSELEYDISEISPIQLTEEWLVKFGFEKWSDEVYFIRIYVQPLHIRLRVFPEIGHAFIDHDKRIKTDLKYIHQLQNLYYSLSGKELTIKKIRWKHN